MALADEVQARSVYQFRHAGIQLAVGPGFEPGDAERQPLLGRPQYASSANPPRAIGRYGLLLGGGAVPPYFVSAPPSSFRVHSPSSSRTNVSL